VFVQKLVGPQKVPHWVRAPPASPFYLKEVFPPGKITVFTLILCPHTTLPLDLLPWKMKKDQVYKSLHVTVFFCFLLVVHLAFPNYLFLVFVGLPVHSFPHRQLSVHMDTLHPINALHPIHEHIQTHTLLL
jgi:hypothetical protein